MANALRPQGKKGRVYFATGIGSPGKGGRLVVWLKDPDGFLLEMVEAKPDWVGAAQKGLDT
jgi:hypothetical protein